MARRPARDGIWYTLAQFQDWYDDRAEDEWQEARRRMAEVGLSRNATQAPAPHDATVNCSSAAQPRDTNKEAVPTVVRQVIDVQQLGFYYYPA